MEYNKKTYIVSSKHLETEAGDPASASDLFLENKIIWKSKGKPYEVTIVDVSREFMYMHTIIAKHVYKAIYRQTFKRGCQKQQWFGYYNR